MGNQLVAIANEMAFRSGCTLLSRKRAGLSTKQFVLHKSYNQYVTIQKLILPWACLSRPGGYTVCRITYSEPVEITTQSRMPST